MENLSVDSFVKCIEEIVKISNDISDGWRMNIKEGLGPQGRYITKKETISLKDPIVPDAQILATFEYHIAYHTSYGVPILCFNVWQKNGTFLRLEDYWRCNENLQHANMYDTLTQMAHPVLCKPFITLHPCRTEEILQPFLEKSKNPVISWLSAVGPFVHLNLLEEYSRFC